MSLTHVRVILPGSGCEYSHAMISSPWFLLLVGGASVLSSSSTSSQEPAVVSNALWDSTSTVSSDSLLLAVLSGSPDDTVSRYEETTR